MRFGYRIIPPPGERKARLPFTPYVYIIPSHYGLDDDGCPLLSPQIIEPEIDGYIEALKEDLDRVGKLAKRALKRAHKKMLSENRDKLTNLGDE